jgi:hypothetical protein
VDDYRRSAPTRHHPSGLRRTGSDGLKLPCKRAVVSSILTGGSTKAQFTGHVAIPAAIKIAFLPSFAVNSIPCRHAGRPKSGLRATWGRKNRSENCFRFPDRRGRTKSQVGCALRRNSRLIVDAALPSLHAIARTDWPSRFKPAICSRSSSERNRAEIIGGPAVIGP